MNEQFSIVGKVAIITGAGGVLGGSIAKCFIQQDVKVVTVDIRQEQLDKRVEELKTYGEDVIGIVGNVLDVASLEKFVNDIVTKWGRIDTLFNIAGGNISGATLAPGQYFYDMDISCWKKVTNLNMNGTVCLPLVSSKVTTKQGKGCTVNVSSMVVYSVITRVSGYSAVKTVVANFTQWLANELALKYGDGIRVNVIAPGFFVGGQNRVVPVNPDGSLIDRSKEALAKTPMKRLGDIDELNGIAQSLCSDVASFVTDTLPPIDGGFGASSGV